MTLQGNLVLKSEIGWLLETVTSEDLSVVSVEDSFLLISAIIRKLEIQFTSKVVALNAKYWT